MLKDFTILSESEVARYKDKLWFSKEVGTISNGKGEYLYLIPDKRLEEKEEPNPIVELMDEFNWKEVYDIMSYLKWTWYGEPEPPSIDKMKQVVLSLYDDIKSSVEANKYAYASTGGFNLTYNPDEDGELSLTFEAVKYSVYSML